MFNISSYLQRTLGKFNAVELQKQQIIEIICKHTNITLEDKDFEIKNGIIQTVISPLQKNLLLIKKQEILKSLEAFNIIDVR